MTETKRDAAEFDLAVYGSTFERDGKRIAPEDVIIHDRLDRAQRFLAPRTVSGPRGRLFIV